MDNFKDLLQISSAVNGHWLELHKESLLRLIENSFKPEIIKHYAVTDIVVLNDKKTLVKWEKRAFELSDEDLEKRFGENKKEE